MVREDPTHCDRCKSAVHRGWVQSINYKTGEIIKTLCVGCDEEEAKAYFTETGHLTTGLVMMASLYEARKTESKTDIAIMAAYAPIPSAIRPFLREVWFGGLQRFAQNASVKGTSFHRDDFKLLCFTICGRAMITLENSSSSLTLICEEDREPPGSMSMQGISATGPQAVALLMRARELWAAGVRATEDREVRILGM
jgi:hypothetical protein